MDERIVRKKVDNDNLSECDLDWTKLPDDIVIHLVSILNTPDRANFSSTCKPWWNVSKSSALWQELDLSVYDCDAEAAKSLASRCANLKKLRFKGHACAASVINLRASELREISGYGCQMLMDSTLAALAARHEALECLYIGPCYHISDDAITTIALCCPKLKKLWLRGVIDVSQEAIHALAHNCPSLTDIGFIGCSTVDVAALGDVKTLRFLSLAGTSDINWDLAPLHWSKLLDLTCLDISVTGVDPRTVSRLLSSCAKLRVLCVLNCPSVEQAAASINHGSKVLVAFFTDILKQLDALFMDMPRKNVNVFLDLRNPDNTNDKNILDWLEWSICQSLLFFPRHHGPGIDNFWLHQGTVLLLSFLQSPHAEVQERAAAALSSYVLTDYFNGNLDVKRVESVVREGGIHFIINRLCSWPEGLQFKAIKSIKILLENDNVAKIVMDEGGVDVLIKIARSATKRVAERAVAVLRDLCYGDEQKDAIGEAGGIRALVDIIVKWSKFNAGEGVLKVAAGALADLTLDDKNCKDVAALDGDRVLVRLLRAGMAESVQEQAACCLANMAYHGIYIDAHAKEPSEALVQLLLSQDDGVREEAAHALCNLSYDERNREAIAAAGGVQALIALVNSCANASRRLQVSAAGALWGLSGTEENCTAIVQEGGVTSLLMLAKSSDKNVQENVAAALWNLAYNSENAMRIIQERGVSKLVRICSYSKSKLARFTSMLALSFMFDTGLDIMAIVSDCPSVSIRLESVRRAASKAIKAYLNHYFETVAFSAFSAAEVLTYMKELVCIEEVDHIRCSELKIGRFANMLGHPNPILKSCGAFALLQFTIPGREYSLHHVNLLKNTNAIGTLHEAATSSESASQEAKAFAQIVLCNLEYHHADT